jgi:type IV pilus assembly protein PilO
MTDPKQINRKFKLALIVFSLFAVASVLVLVSPIGRGARESQQELSALWSELQSKTRETMPLQGIDSKVKEAKTQIDQFYGERLPDRFARIPEELGKLASANGVSLSAAKYKTEDTDFPGVRRVTVDASLSGPYGQEARFINAVERDKMFFVINSVSLGETPDKGVHLQISLETYVRSGPSA